MRPLARNPQVLVGWPFPLGPWVLVWTSAFYWHGVGRFMFNSSSSVGYRHRGLYMYNKHGGLITFLVGGGGRSKASA